MWVMFDALYDEYAIPTLPLVIASAAAGDYEHLVTLMEGGIPGLPYRQSTTGSERPLPPGDVDDSDGVYYAVECHEEMPFEDATAAAAAVAGYPQQVREPLVEDIVYMERVCEMWSVGSASTIEREPVVSAVPALILAGTFDPITPPRWGQITAQRLRNSVYVEVPTGGHGVYDIDPCPLDITLAFLDNPNRVPDTGCLADMDPVAFVVP